MRGIPWESVEDEILSRAVAAGLKTAAIMPLLPERSRKSIEGRMERLAKPKEVKADPGPDTELLAEITAFRKTWRLNKTEFGVLALHSPGYVRAIEQGRRSSPSTVEKVRRFMAAGSPQARPRTRGQYIASRYRKAMCDNMERERAAREFRETDPAERAKAFIRKERFHCFNAEILKPHEIGKFFIGPNLVTREALLEFARRRGWDG